MDIDGSSAPPRVPTPPLGRGHRVKRPSRLILERQPEGPKLSKAGARRLAKMKKDAAEKAAIAARPIDLEPVRDSEPEPAQERMQEPELEPMQEPEPELELEPEPTQVAQPDSVSMFGTIANAFGLWRQYVTEPVTIPDMSTEADSEQASNDETSSETIEEIISPYPNLSAFRIAHLTALYTRVTTSLADLFRTVRLSPLIKDEDIQDINFNALKNKVAESCKPWEEGKHGWRKGSLTINIPSNQNDQENGNSQHTASDTLFEVNDFWYRPILPLMRTILTASPVSKRFNFVPYRQWWTRPESSDPPSRVYDELYTSDSWLEEHQKVQEIVLPNEEADTYPRAIAGLMFWSDSTHLAEFGQAKLWPIYMAFGNQSKYERAKPGNRALLHLAYLPSVSVSSWICVILT